MKAGLLLAGLAAFCTAPLLPVQAHDWGKKYSTGRFGDVFESCCGNRDCHTAESLGFPQMISHPDGSYEVRVGKYWIHFDFPAVHPSEDSKAWICYMETQAEPEPLCLFLPPGII